VFFGVPAPSVFMIREGVKPIVIGYQVGTPSYDLNAIASKNAPKAKTQMATIYSRRVATLIYTPRPFSAIPSSGCSCVIQPGNLG